MDKNTWCQILLDMVSEFESKSYQDKVWSCGEGDDVSSWDDAICQFFDDYDVDGFINKYIDEFDDDKKNCLIKFRNSLSSYSDAMEATPPPEKILTDPNWGEIRKLAGIVLDKWHYPKRNVS